ncbi:MAG TPA: aromatic amino acid ammonia-lyase [Candidatus Limnocylindrales bacterium]|nr:aromatic amino acid ammonia-lyase [Candidatus Limnocylindrales bacterium]
MTARTSEAAAAGVPAAARVVFGSDLVGVDEVVSIAFGLAEPAISADPAFLARLEAGRTVLERCLSAGEPVYGVSTGVGASVENDVPEHLQADLARNLFRFHGCGTGRILDPTEASAVIAVRLASLARGYSAVRPVVLEHLALLVARGVLPRIPEEGSVGASGDLTPLAYVAGLLAGEGEAVVSGQTVPARDALAAAGIAPLVLAPKESLALMNGTSVMAGIASLVLVRAERLAKLAAAITAMTSAATLGNAEHFDDAVLGLKPHAGTVEVGSWIRAFLAGGPSPEPLRLQDRYSVRCAPHVLGVLVDACALARRVLDIEIAGVNDNPVIDPESGRVLHGGNFYGGHVVFALDALKGAMASAADLLDRQLVLLCLPETSGGLPANLVASPRVSHHGFKAMQITASALAAEAAKTSLPAAVFSRSTESHNQDKVSMGTLASREARRVVELAETVATITLLAACQAVDLRMRSGGSVPEAVATLHDAVRRRVPPLEQDRRQDGDIAAVLELLRSDGLPIDLELPEPGPA